MDEKGRSIRTFLLIVVLIVLIVVGLGIYRSGGIPGIRIEPGMAAIGMKTPVNVIVSEPRRGLKHVKVELLQSGNAITLVDKSYQIRRYFFFGTKTVGDTMTMEVGRAIYPSLTAGSASIRVTADRISPWYWHRDPEVREITLPVRLTPPSLQTVSVQTYVAQGGCEAVVYRVGESSVRDGVRAGSWWFPGYPLPGGGKQDRFAVFAVPYNMTDTNVKLTAEDAAGNKAEKSFIDKLFAKSFKADVVEVSDAFINKVIAEILPQSPEINDRGNPVENYLAINRELRRKNAETLKASALKSKPEFLWTKPFISIPNGKVMAGFADRRTYRYNGRIIDNQDHLGYDLAVTQHSPIPAANDGIVLFAGFFGIYGNAVLIDHGYGLMSLYGHLSAISVNEGQKVARGDIIGKTGDTGLAAGDHLHFSMVLQGLPVNPVEWWDGHWIQDRIAKKLGASFKFSE